MQARGVVQVVDRTLAADELCFRRRPLTWPGHEAGCSPCLVRPCADREWRSGRSAAHRKAKREIVTQPSGSGRGDDPGAPTCRERTAQDPPTAQCTAPLMPASALLKVPLTWDFSWWQVLGSNQRRPIV